MARTPSPVAPPTKRDKTPPVCSTFAEELQAAVDAGKVFELNDDITLTEPAKIIIRHSHQGWFGLDGRYHKIFSAVKGKPALEFVMEDSVTPQGTCARAFLMANLTVLGGGHEEGGIKLDVPAQQSWLVNPTLRDLWIEGCRGKAAFTMRGNIFEGTLYSVGTQDNHGAGLYFANAGGHAICSAIRLVGGTQRQNGGPGYLIDQYDGPGDVRIAHQYYCLNRGGGIVSYAGCELVLDCGFENNTDFGINIQNYATLIRCTGSTMGTQPQLIIGYLANPWHITDCAMTGYSGADPHFGSFTGNGQRLTLRGRYDPAKLTIGNGVDAVFAP